MSSESHRNEAIFTKIDEVLNRRVSELSNEEFASLMGIVASHNMEC